MLISEILDNNSRLKEIDYNKHLSSEEIEMIVYALAPFVGFDVHDVTPSDVSKFHVAMREGKNEIDFD